MKIKNILMTAAIALVSVASANANTSFTQGDLFIGFRVDGSTNDYLLDLGQGFDFTKSFTFNLAGTTLASDLATKAFDSNWIPTRPLLMPKVTKIRSRATSTRWPALI